MWIIIRLFTIISGGLVSFFNPMTEWRVWIAIASFFILLGLISLIRWGDMLVSGSSSIATKFGIPPIVVWLTILAFGTSAPELFVNLIASAKWETGLLLSNIIWSNLSNILLIWWSASIIAFLPIQKSTFWKELPLSLLATWVLLVLVNDTLLKWSEASNVISMQDGILLLVMFVWFLRHVFNLVKNHDNTAYEEDIPDGQMKTGKAIFLIILGIYGLYVWGDLIVAYASILAEMFGVSKVMIGASIVAIGTSVPELVTSVIAARKKQTDMAIGNIIGSNIFNILRILWLCSVIRPVTVDTVLHIDITILIVVTILLWITLYLQKDKALHRTHGFILVTLYFCYLAFLIWRG